jgi:hypothetical protein
MNTFIRATEVWVPNHDGTRLVLGSSHYGDMTSFASISQSMSFAYDEGLPGKAWACGHPVILKRLERSYFKRIELAHEYGLTCGIALPIRSGEFIKAVVVFLCGDTDKQVGAIELWHNDSNTGHDLNLLDGYYGTAELFEWRSQRTSFRKGVGLPGETWEQNRPVFVSNLVESSRFIRREGAEQAGLTKGIGLPFTKDSQHAYVVALLSAQGTPIARRFEIWTPDRHDATRLIFAGGDCDIHPNFFEGYRNLDIKRGDGVIGRMLYSGVPVVSSVDCPLPSIAEINAKKVGLKTIVAIPMIHDGHLTRIVSWYF